MARTVRHGGNERWQGTVISENEINMENADYLSFFPIERTGARLPTADSGVPGVKCRVTFV